MRKLFLLFFVMLAISITVHAQSRTITGVVTSKKDNETLIGVTIAVKGSTTATSTDVNGKFSIKVTNLQNVVLSAKFIGYEYQEVTVKPEVKVVDFQLTESNSTLNEVVVTGYGTTVKGKILGAVSEIKAADIEDLPEANLGTALRNRVSGVGVSVTSGKPGAATTLSLRNPVTFTSGIGGITSNPLYVIDGLVASVDDFNSMDASLVESISFIKDASAAIYGASGDKGVVIITTKKGKIGKTQFSYSGYYGTSDAAEVPKMLNAYQQATLLNDGFAANNSPNNNRFAQADLDFLATNPYPSWYSQLWHSSSLQRHTVNLSGGSEKLQFFAGASYYNEGGNYGTVTTTKYNIRSGMTAKLSNDVTAYLSLNTNYSKGYSNSLKSSSSTDQEDSQFLAILTTPQWVPLLINGFPNGYADLSSNSNWNPIALYNSGTYNTTNAQTINLNSSLEWRPKLVKGLTFKEQFGKNNQISGSNQWLVPYPVYNFTRVGQNSRLYSTVPTSKPSQINSNSDQLQQGNGYNNSYELISSVNYARVIGKHTFDIMALSDLTEGSSGSNLLYRTTAQIPGVNQFYAYPSSTTTVQLNNGVNTGKQSYLGKLNYDYAGKYLMQVITRVDGSTNFAPDKRWGAFPDLGLGWRVSEEQWFKNSVAAKYVNSLKLRFNIGLVGDDRITPYQWFQIYNPAANNYIFGSGNIIANGINPNSTYPNPDVTWEKQRQTNFGIDATFLDDRLTTTIEIYNRHTYDGFQDLSKGSVVPQTTGIAQGAINVGIQNSWGTEFDVSFVQPVSKDWTIRANLTFGFSNSNIVNILYNKAEIGTVQALTDITIGTSPRTYTNTNIGYIATGIIKTQADVDAILAKNPNYTINGLKPQPGFLNFKDINGDGKIDANDVTLMYPSVNSPFGTGFTLGASYKTLSFSVNGSAAFGGKVQTDGQAKKATSPTLNVPAFWADHWTPDNVDAKFPRADAPLVDQSSTFWTVSATALRINNMSLSYSLPRGIADRFGIPNLRIVASGTNLWNIINPYNYKDPLTSNYADYPTLRTFSLGLNVTL